MVIDTKLTAKPILTEGYGEIASNFYFTDAGKLIFIS